MADACWLNSCSVICGSITFYMFEGSPKEGRETHALSKWYNRFSWPHSVAGLSGTCCCVVMEGNLSQLKTSFYRLNWCHTKSSFLGISWCILPFMEMLVNKDGASSSSTYYEHTKSDLLVSSNSCTSKRNNWGITVISRLAAFLCFCNWFW